MLTFHESQVKTRLPALKPRNAGKRIVHILVCREDFLSKAAIGLSRRVAFDSSQCLRLRRAYAVEAICKARRQRIGTCNSSIGYRRSDVSEVQPRAAAEIVAILQSESVIRASEEFDDCSVRLRVNRHS